MVTYRAEWHYGNDRRSVETHSLALLSGLIDLPGERQAEMVAALDNGGPYTWSWWTVWRSE